MNLHILVTVYSSKLCHMAIATNSSITHSVFEPFTGEVLHEVMQRLKALSFPLDLSSLARVELSIASKYDVRSFSDLGNGSFLQFVATHKALGEELGEGLVGAGSGAVAASKEKALRIVSQLATKELRENEVRQKCSVWPSWLGCEMCS